MSEILEQPAVEETAPEPLTGRAWKHAFMTDGRYSRVMTDAATWPGVFLCGKDALAVARRLDEYAAAFRLPDDGLQRVEAERHLRETQRLSALLHSCRVTSEITT